MWQGRPTRYFAPGVGTVVPVVFGHCRLCYLSGRRVFSLAIFFMIIGLSLATYALFNGMLIRRWSHYALTNHRAFVLINHPLLGVDVTDWPINAETDLRHNAYDPMTITFAPHRIFGRHMRVIGFEHIEDGLSCCPP